MDDAPVPAFTLSKELDYEETEYFLPSDTFACFNPVTGKAATAFAWQFDGIATRARTLLPDWTAKHILDAADRLSLLLACSPDSLTDTFEGQLMRPSDASGSTVSQVANTHARYEMEDVFDDPGSPTPAHTWPCIFAAYALVQIALAHRFANINRPLDTLKPDDTAKERYMLFDGHGLGPWPLDGADDLSRETLAVVGQHAIVAMEAVCCAESLQNMPKKITTEKSAQAQKAINTRHNKHTALRHRVETLYRENPNFGPHRAVPLSNRRMAELIWNKDLTDEEKSVLRGEYPTHTLAKWIGSYRRANEPG